MHCRAITYTAYTILVGLSSLTKLFRVTALALKFINKLKRTARSNDQLDSEETSQVETLWTRYIQKLHYSDVIDAIHKKKKKEKRKKNFNNNKEQLGIHLNTKNILRYCGRLANPELTEEDKLPIFIPKTDR